MKVVPYETYFAPYSVSNLFRIFWHQTSQLIVSTTWLLRKLSVREEGYAHHSLGRSDL